jgi:hypothetical protein
VPDPFKKDRHENTAHVGQPVEKIGRAAGDQDLVSLVEGSIDCDQEERPEESMIC